MYDESVITTTSGPIRGRILDGVHTFKGIRYGKDTGGARRFLPPEEPEPWKDVANALEYGPMAPQHDPRAPVRRSTNPFNVKVGLTDDLPESEDCLFLNIWTTGPAGRRPVMVWVHSGGFATNSGSAPSTDGALLARDHGVVIVSFNHRLGPLGYTQVTDDPASPFFPSGNVGMLDIVAVLRWVARDIEAFGGDPGNVTLFGQSGGAMKISTLLAMPAAAGLFHKAILQSGATSRVRGLDEGRTVASELYAAAGVDDGDVPALQSLPLQDLMAAYQHLAARRGLAAAAPVVDGEIIPAPPHAEGSATTDVPIIVGDLDTEATLFLAGRAEQLRDRDDADLVARLAQHVDISDARRLVDACRRVHPEADGYDMSAALLSALVFTANADELATLHSARSAQPCFRYRITWRTPVDDGLFGSPHEVDVALTFGNVEAALGLNGGGEDARELSRTIREAWTAFARSSSPVSPRTPEWPVFDHRRLVLTLSPGPGLRPDVDAEIHRAALPLVRTSTNWFPVLG